MVAQVFQQEADGDDADNGAGDEACDQYRQLRGDLAGVRVQGIGELQKTGSEEGGRAEQKAEARCDVSPQAGCQPCGDGGCRCG